ncbi:MAG: hypothetical protein R3293_16505 [Candidatus Promineifilaceae bacterium]|nr:hypothetical protein [Candidatus Promineifilaceae bacterium]
MTDQNQTAEPELGFLFPRTSADTRSTTATGKNTFAAALAALDESAAAAVMAEEKWRSHYPRHIYELVKFSALAPDSAVKSAAAGLDSLRTRFEFAREDQIVPITAISDLPPQRVFYTARIEGTASPARELRIPYEGQLLSGPSLTAQIARWTAAGTIEPSHGQALQTVANHPQWLDLSEQQFVLLGAGAEMGPLDLLLEWGATIIAVDLQRPEIWQRLIAKARHAAGTFLFPLRVPFTDDMSDNDLAAHAGVDLLTETPEIIAWLRTFEGPMTVGGYAYLDGQLHVRVVLAMDAIVVALTNGASNTSLAFLATPTDVFAVPEETAAMAQERFDSRRAERLYQEPVRALSGGRYFRPNVQEMIITPAGVSYGLIDSLVTQQGPNYALAKRIQQWRAIVARASGVRVSANVAPATTTYSVIRNIALAAAYAGAERFGIEIFAPETSNAVMAAQLIYDLRSPDSIADPAVSLNNPLELFMSGANHGGLWRAAFASRSVLEIAALLGWREARSQAHDE